MDLQCRCKHVILYNDVISIVFYDVLVDSIEIYKGMIYTLLKLNTFSLRRGIQSENVNIFDERETLYSL